MKTQFIWNAAKAASNLQKHGIAFEAATQVFADPLRLDEIDKHEREETRWRTIGQVNGEYVILVVHTGWEENDVEIVRLISARPASVQERKRYEQNRYSLLY
jgi:uncharacterized protein